MPSLLPTTKTTARVPGRLARSRTAHHDPDDGELAPDLNLIDSLLAAQQSLQTPAAKFAAEHDHRGVPDRAALYRHLIPLERPSPGEQFAFQVELDKCTGCKACVAACHNLNGLDDGESWRSTGTLAGGADAPGWQQTVTTACHHCRNPECLHGCPVGAYHKDDTTGIVRHLDDQCIGCQYCIMMCPYEVPRYSSRRGIVRKCDMCRQRLEAGEAPACVQACPTEAIRIVKVATAASAGEGFLPGAPDPAITRPATRFVGRDVPRTAASSNRDALVPQPAHHPLAVMLVLSQCGVGLATAGVLAGSFALLLVGAAAFLLALAASVFHLGRPLGAWRFFLGLRRSWLSREILAFGLTGTAMTAALLLSSSLPVLAAIALCATGWLAVFTSVMVYADTARPAWSFPRTAFRFFGTALLAVLLGLCLTGLLPPLLFSTALALKIAVEAIGLLRAYDREWSPLRHSARIHLHPLRRVLQARMVLGAGAVCLTPLWLPGAAALFLSGELLERHLFFRSAAAVRMPGAAPA